MDLTSIPTVGVSGTGCWYPATNPTAPGGQTVTWQSGGQNVATVRDTRDWTSPGKSDAFEQYIPRAWQDGSTSHGGGGRENAAGSQYTDQGDSGGYTESGSGNWAAELAGAGVSCAIIKHEADQRRCSARQGTSDDTADESVGTDAKTSVPAKLGWLQKARLAAVYYGLDQVNRTLQSQQGAIASALWGSPSATPSSWAGGGASGVGQGQSWVEWGKSAAWRTGTAIVSTIATGVSYVYDWGRSAVSTAYSTVDATKAWGGGYLYGASEPSGGQSVGPDGKGVEGEEADDVWFDAKQQRADGKRGRDS